MHSIHVAMHYTSQCIDTDTIQAVQRRKQTDIDIGRLRTCLLYTSGVVLLGTLLTVVASYATGISLPDMVGILCGATTNTPALGAAQQTLKQMGMDSSTPALGCAVAYPMGVVGVILAVLLIRKVLDVYKRQDYPCFDLTPHEQDIIREYYSFIRKRLKNKEDLYRREVVMGLMQGFFFELCNIFNSHAPTAAATVKNKSRKEYIFERFYESLIESYQSERSVKFYADQLCLTPKHLSGVVKEVSGKTVGEWIDELVILEAKALLNSSSMNIQAVSYTHLLRV